MMVQSMRASRPIATLPQQPTSYPRKHLIQTFGWVSTRQRSSQVVPQPAAIVQGLSVRLDPEGKRPVCC